MAVTKGEARRKAEGKSIWIPWRGRERRVTVHCSKWMERNFCSITSYDEIPESGQTWDAAVR